MPCFVPFKNNLDLTFFVMRSVSVLDDDIIHSLKCLSFQAEDLGCVYSSMMRSIHGNLLSAIEDLSHLAILIQHGFYSVFAGESKDGRKNARFSAGDTILLSGMIPASDQESASSDLSRACMEILRSSFNNVEASTAGVCLQCRDRPLVAMFHVWKSLQACYSWLITSDYRRTIRPYISSFSNEAQFDIFKVVYVSSDDVLNCEVFESKPDGIGIGRGVGKGGVELG